MQIKRFTVFLLAAVLLAFCACSNNQDDNAVKNEGLYINPDNTNVEFFFEIIDEKTVLAKEQIERLNAQTTQLTETVDITERAEFEGGVSFIVKYEQDGAENNLTLCAYDFESAPAYYLCHTKQAGDELTELWYALDNEQDRSLKKLMEDFQGEAGFIIR